MATQAVTDDNFESDVLKASGPVVVDFWAEWCGPCRMLGPVLEAAVEAREGAVWLVKVDTEANQDLALEHGIRGIPAVKAFVARALVGEFVGARDRRAVDAFIDQVCPSAEQSALQRARQSLAQDQPEAVASLLEPALLSSQHADEAYLLLAQAHVAQVDYVAAIEALDRLDERSLFAEQARGLRARIAMLSSAGTSKVQALLKAAEKDAADAETQWALAGAYLRDGDYERCLDALLALLQSAGRGYRDDAVRLGMLAVFDHLGGNHDLVRDYRRKLMIYL